MAEQAGKRSSRAKKVIEIILNVLFACFFVLCVFGLILSIAAKKDAEGAVELFGHEMRLVVSPSMEKCESTDVSGYDIKDLPVHTLVFVETVPENEEEAIKWYASLRVGDVLTFRYVYTTQETITHRIVGIDPSASGGYTVTLEGDNKNYESGVLQQVIDTGETDSPNYIIGKVTGSSVALGYLITAVQSPYGLVFIIIVPCAIIIILEIIRIVGVFAGKKKERLADEQRKKDEEIEELKRRLAEATGNMERNGVPSSGGTENKEGEEE